MPDRKPGPDQAAPALRRRTLVGGFLLRPSSVGAAANPGGDDALLVELCQRARSLDAQDGPVAAPLWDDAVYRPCAVPAVSAVGLRAKAELLLTLPPTSTDGLPHEAASPDEQLLSSLLADLLRLSA